MASGNTTSGSRIKDRYNLLFWVLVGCTIITVIVTLMMMYRMSQKPSPLPTSAPPPPPSQQQQQQVQAQAQLPLQAAMAVPLSGPSNAVEERFANSEHAGGIVYVYSETCGWCDRFNPIWKDFADRYAGPLRLVKVEAKDPTASRYDVSGYPTVLAVKGDAVVATFDADRTVENLMKFASKHE